MELMVAGQDERPPGVEPAPEGMQVGRPASLRAYARVGLQL